MKENSEQFVHVHPKFRLNGMSHCITSLRTQAHKFIKDGASYEKSAGSFLLDWLDDKEYISVHTSGSTGAPKDIRISKIHMVQSANATAKHFKLKEKTTALLCLPTDFIAGKMMLVRALVLGWHIDMAAPKTNPLDGVEKRYDFSAMTPFQLDNSLSKLHFLNKLIVGGGMISYPLIKKVAEVSTKIYETYGMTETVTHIAARRINPKNKKKHPIPFKALSKVNLEVDDRGCLVVNAPAVSSSSVITNDLVNLIINKEFVWLGRIDNVINSGGIKLYPEQIEQKLAAFIDIPFFVAGIPDDALGEKLVLFVEQEEDYTLSTLDYDASVFGPYEFPKVIFTLASFERTENGKLQRGQTVRKALFNS